MSAINSQREALEWKKIITDWPNYWTNFQRNFQGLLAQSSFIQTQSPEVRRWYDGRVRSMSQLYNEANSINLSVSRIKGAWDNFSNWITGLMGMSSMGILPIIPLAISAAGASAIIYKLISAFDESAKDARTIELLREAKNQGLSPDQATDILNKRGAGGFADILKNLQKFLPWIAIGGAVLLILPKILEKR